MADWWTRQSRDRKTKKGDVRVEKETQKEEGEKMENFLGAFLTDAKNLDVTNFLCTS